MRASTAFEPGCWGVRFEQTDIKAHSWDQAGTAADNTDQLQRGATTVGGDTHSAIQQPAFALQCRIRSVAQEQTRLKSAGIPTITAELGYHPALDVGSARRARVPRQNQILCAPPGNG